MTAGRYYGSAPEGQLGPCPESAGYGRGLAVRSEPELEEVLDELSDDEVDEELELDEELTPDDELSTRRSEVVAVLLDGWSCRYPWPFTTRPCLSPSELPGADTTITTGWFPGYQPYP